MERMSWLALLATAVAGPVWAAEPSFDCTAASSSAEEAICSSEALASLDREMARLYGLAAEGPHMDPDRLAGLRAYQRGWIKGRDECWKAEIGLERCIAEAYADRIHDLRMGYADARSEPGDSLGPFAYVCEGLAFAISAVFVNTAESAVSLKWGEVSMVLPLTPAASGSRYAGDAWGEGPALFWIRGDEAVFATPGQPELQCRQDEIG